MAEDKDNGESFIERYGGKKFTAESVEASTKRAIANVSEVREKKSGKILKYGTMAVLVAAIGVFSVMWSNDNSATANTLAVGNQKIIELEAQIKDAQFKENTVMSSEDIQRQIYTAGTKGVRIAELQNGFNTIMSKPDDDARLKAIDDQKYELTPFFTKVAENSSFNPLTPWYIKWTPDSIPAAMADPATYGWSFASAYPTDDPATLTMVWLNQEKDSGKILAWAKGEYQMDIGEIISIEVGRTTYGQSFVPGSVDVDGEAAANEGTGRISPATPGESMSGDDVQ